METSLTIISLTYVVVRILFDKIIHEYLKFQGGYEKISKKECQ